MTGNGSLAYFAPARSGNGHVWDLNGEVKEQTPAPAFPSGGANTRDKAYEMVCPQCPLPAMVQKSGSRKRQPEAASQHTPRLIPFLSIHPHFPFGHCLLRDEVIPDWYWEFTGMETPREPATGTYAARISSLAASLRVYHPGPGRH